MISRFLTKLSPRFLRPSKRSLSEYQTSVKQYTMNDIPVPHEPFESGYKRRQVGNNTVLIGGITFCALSFYYVLNSGVIFFNLTPPRKNPE